MNIEYKNHTITIEQDTYAENPRKGIECNTTFVMFHGRYDFGDSHKFKSPESLEKYLARNAKSLYVLPVYMYDHSGLTIKTTPFSCQWDSGKIGYIYINKETFEKEVNGIAPYDYLRMCVDELNSWLVGDVWGYKITKDDEEVESCWGFYGYDYVVDEAKSVIDNICNTIES